jgi:hypothetical protein
MMAPAAMAGVWIQLQWQGCGSSCKGRGVDRSCYERLSTAAKGTQIVNGEIVPVDVATARFYGGSHC